MGDLRKHGPQEAEKAYQMHHDKLQQNRCDGHPKSKAKEVEEMIDKISKRQ